MWSVPRKKLHLESEAERNSGNKKWMLGINGSFSSPETLTTKIIIIKKTISILTAKIRKENCTERILNNVFFTQKIIALKQQSESKSDDISDNRVSFCLPYKEIIVYFTFHFISSSFFQCDLWYTPFSSLALKGGYQEVRHLYHLASFTPFTIYGHLMSYRLVICMPSFI